MTLIPPPVEAEQPPMNISMKRSILDIAGHDMKSANVKPEVDIKLTTCVKA